MKQCPICGASAFDDARVCYGCLHRFDSDEPRGLDHSFPQEKDEASALWLTIIHHQDQLMETMQHLLQYIG